MKNFIKTNLRRYLVKSCLFFLIFAFFPLSVGQIAAQTDPESTVAKELGLQFVLIEPGSFVMGAEPTLEKFTSYATPKHEVTISKPFYLGKFEVTQQQWTAIMGRNPSRYKGASNPVDSVSWDRAQEFADKLNEKEGRTIFRLPTEAEWEYAARAGTSTVYPFGNRPNSLGDYAWFSNNSGMTTHPVGQKRPNPWGLYDMFGNVREWTGDWIGTYPDEPVTDPKGPDKGTDKVARGGAFSFIDVNCTSSRRVGYRPDYKQNFHGLRLVMMLEEEKAPVPEEGIAAAPPDNDKAPRTTEAEEPSAAPAVSPEEPKDVSELSAAGPASAGSVPAEAAPPESRPSVSSPAAEGS
ncbi:MAG: SUMF1/EgtB/PvdO family nonheme iron enzyme [Deltaproteobacteria bacterium]|nr:SUMF1/EgtB/PvdO family nonheme iron enzyme [Deltaproteobacteria bacterium]